MATRLSSKRPAIHQDENINSATASQPGVTMFAKRVLDTKVSVIDKENVNITKKPATKRAPLADIQVSSSSIQSLDIQEKKLAVKRSVMSEIPTKPLVPSTGNAGNSKPGPQAKITRTATGVARASVKVPKKKVEAEKASTPISLTISSLAHEHEDSEAVMPSVSLSEYIEPMVIDEAAAQKEQIEDVDAADRDDPLHATEYVNDIFDYLREKEVIEKVNANYMASQADINAMMRAMLIDWLVEVHVHFRLTSDTLFLAVNILDRFLTRCADVKKSIPRSKLQLVGLTALLIASKMEEIYELGIVDLVYICNSAFTREDIVHMESIILNALGFNLTVPNVLHFFRRTSKVGSSDALTHTLAKYIVELSLLDYGTLNFLPSQIAASAMWLARKMLPSLHKECWNATLAHYTKYQEQDLTPCIKHLNNVMKNRFNPPMKELKAITSKYWEKNLYSVARIPAVNLD